MAYISPSRSHDKGFTLIEMAIVLVVIALIVGGILVGRDMIEAAEIRADITEGDKIVSAINAFRLKYNCLPGDCPNATDFFGTGTYGDLPNGDGNGMIRGYESSSASETEPDTNGTYLSVTAFSHTQWGQEWFSMFDHLAAAGLYNISQYEVGDSWTPDSANNRPGIAYPQMHWQHGDYDPDLNATPFAASPGGIIVGHEIDAHYVRYGACPYTGWGPQTMTFVCGFTGAAAYEVDSKIDDGKPLTGSVQATDAIYILRTSTTSGGPDSNCVNGSEYASQTSMRSCALRRKAAF